jgi:uncharacterized protein (TIGR03435 family)
MQCNEVRNYFADYLKERLEAPTQAEFARHLRECSSCRSEVEALTDAWIKMGALPAGEPPSPDMDIRFRMAIEEYKDGLKQTEVLTASSSRIWAMRSLFAAAVVSLVVISFWVSRAGRLPQPSEARLEDGSLYRVTGGKTSTLNAGDGIRLNDTFRSGAGAMLVLADGSRVEMRAESELSLERANDGLSIHLTRGGVIINAAKQRSGHLYVETRDVIVSVVGTVFLVNAEEQGSRVAVIQGEVRVQQGGVEKRLRPGEQVATNPVMEPMPVAKELSWSRNAESHRTLLERSVASATQAAIASLAPPQAPETPKWETISVKPCNENSRPPGVRGAGPRPSPGRLFIECMTVQQMIQMYMRSAGEKLLNASGRDVVDTTGPIRGGPSWVRSDKYLIEAKTDGTPENKIMMGPMTRAILEDRFQLRLRHETEEVPMYSMTVAKSGLKIKSVDMNNCRKYQGESLKPEEEWAIARSGEKPICGTVNGGSHGPNVVWYYGGQTLENFANLLSANLDRHVLDKTGVPGSFIIFLEYLRDENVRARPGETDVSSIQPGPSILTAIEELGLKLEPTKGPREYLAIDHIERPIEN